MNIRKIYTQTHTHIYIYLNIRKKKSQQGTETLKEVVQRGYELFILGDIKNFTRSWEA